MLDISPYDLERRRAIQHPPLPVPVPNFDNVTIIDVPPTANNSSEPEPTTTTETKTITAAWQTLMNAGRTHLARRQLELALQHFTSALHLCDGHPAVLPAAEYRYRVLGDLGWVQRLSGRYEDALGCLREALALSSLPSSSSSSGIESVEGGGESVSVGEGEGEGEGVVEGESQRKRPRVLMVGEVGTVYRLMGRLEEAKSAFEEQLALAGGLDMLVGARCRALGNLGGVNYQLAARRWELEEGGVAERAEVEVMVGVAVRQLEECMRLAGGIMEEEGKRGGHGPSTREREATGWKATAYGRLSLCYTLLASMGEKEMMEKAAEAAEAAVDEARYLSGSILPMSRFFYGRVLLRQGHKERALKQFNPKETYEWETGVTTPAMAMCKEPSGEHRGYLGEMIEAGADLDFVDPEGYTALDHAVFGGDAETEAMVVEGLRRQLLHLSESDVAARRTEARLRKGYREVLQEKLRPILYRRKDSPDCIKNLRRAYAETLAADPEKSRLFDHLKFIRYTDLEGFGRLPRSSDGLVRSFQLPETQTESDNNDLDVLIFFSYRWINQDRSLNTPDDANHTQYRRMLDAIGLYLQQNPSVDKEKLCVWMDFACVDQDNPGTGVSALPIIITQCDAVISLVDDTYYERAWCCVETKMISALDRSYGWSVHRWYEHMPAATSTEPATGTSTEQGGWTLERARPLQLDMKDMKLTYEHDRPKVMFLERQSKFMWRL